MSERDDTRFIEGASIIDRYFELSFKPTERIIADNERRFAALSDVDDIRVLGHSLSDVDRPYLQKIAACVRPAVQWRVSCRNTSAALEDRFATFASIAAHSGDREHPDRSIVNTQIGHRERSEATLGC